MRQVNKQLGFTLIEMVIVVLIVGILSAIAFPAYDDYIKRSRRGDGMDTLMDAAQRMEVFRGRTASYTNTAALAGIDTDSAEGYYGNLTITSAPCGNIANCYTLSVTPTTKSNQDDDDVQAFSYDSTGLKQRLIGGVWTNSWQ